MPNSIFTEKEFEDYEYLNIDMARYTAEPPDMFRSELPQDYTDLRHILVRIIKNLDYLPFTCKYLFNFNLLPYQHLILKELFVRPFPILIGSRGSSKSTLMALYAMLRCILSPGSKVVIAGSAFRQSKLLFETVENIWYKSSILRDIYSRDRKSGPHKDPDKYTLNMGDSFICAIPIGNDGGRVRGLRATHLLIDEYSVHRPEVFETVLSGFAAVAQDPFENVKYRGRMRRRAKVNKHVDKIIKNLKANQTILAGTATYQWNHFYSYWLKYHKIVHSKGDEKKLAQIFPNGVDPGFDWRDYSVIRIPIEKIPPGMMDEGTINRSQATMHCGTFDAEFGAVWITDSTGFFRRSLIEACTTYEPKDFPSGVAVAKAMLRGNRNCRYVMGIDPASEKDSFAIVILEVHEDHRQVVYCWTTTRDELRERINASVMEDQDYYGYCARKIRELMELFNIEHIALDSQGGGIAVIEALHDRDKLKFGELPIYPIIPDHPLSDGKERHSDDLPGKHIVEMVNFARAEYVSEANHGMRKDMEDMVLLFPAQDAITGIRAESEDVKNNRLYDTMEECYYEIELLKDELVTIILTRTGTAMRDHWDTPEIKTADNKKGRLRKDRYSALVMANMAARRLQRTPAPLIYTPVGGVKGGTSRKSTGALYVGPDWFVSGSSATTYGAGVTKGSVYN